jgi:hypothetical protein
MLSRLIAFLFLTSCSLFSFKPPVVEDFEGAKFLMYAFDHNQEIECVQSTKLMLRIIKARLDSHKISYFETLTSSKFKPRDCLKTCTCEMWMELAQKNNHNTHLHELNEFSRMQNEKACFERTKTKFCKSQLYKDLEAQEIDFIMN